MKYLSTRGGDKLLTFEEAVLRGLAPNGGLYIPEHIPQLPSDWQTRWASLSFPELSYEIVSLFVPPTAEEGGIPPEDLRALINKAYGTFRSTDVTPLTRVSEYEYCLELWHGPTFAFKDVALQLLGRLFDHVLAKKAEHVTIVGATSGDTGSAAIEACRDREAVDIFILHPKGRTSEVQRRQMTTVLSDNVHNIALEGSFDDCQDLVKAMFNDTSFRDEQNLSAVNSINWARIMAQIVYYFAAAIELGAPDRQVSFAVPTGNFGNVYAAYGARAMGLPIQRLVVGTNSNDILARFFATGTMQTQAVMPTISPSMDIQISSNFERLLFDLYDRDGPALNQCMGRFRSGGSFAVTPAQLERAIERREQLNLNLEEGAAPLEELRMKLEELLERRMGVEDELKLARLALEDADRELRDAEQRLHSARCRCTECSISGVRRVIRPPGVPPHR